jgi:hypothetical protein
MLKSVRVEDEEEEEVRVGGKRGLRAREHKIIC